MSVLKKVLYGLTIFTIFLCGCASAPDKSISRKDLSAVGQVKIVRNQFPGYFKETISSTVLSGAVATPFMLFGAIGGGVGGAIYGSLKSSMMLNDGKEMQDKYNLPDFTELVQKQLSEKLPLCLSEKMKVMVENVPVDDDSQGFSGYVVIVRTRAVISDGTGLQATAFARMMDPNKNVLWQKTFHYRSDEVGRVCDLEKLEENNGKLLLEEIAFAADRAALDLFNHLSGAAAIENAKGNAGAAPAGIVNHGTGKEGVAGADI